MAQAELSFGGKTYELEVIEGTENEKGIDISKLRAQSGLITLDPGFVNTGSCESKITFIDGEAGILRYRGYPIEEVCDKANFLETAYLLIFGKMPSGEEYAEFQQNLNDEAILDSGIERLLESFPREAHPMAMLCSAVSAMAGFYPYDTDCAEQTQRAVFQLVAKFPALVAAIYRTRLGRNMASGSAELGYASNFLQLMFSEPHRAYEVDPEVAKALDLLLILHGDHEQNCSAATVRVVGSSKVNLFASIAGGCCSLWGPLHGGANQAVLEMLTRIHKDGGDVKKYIELAKDKSSNFRLMGFGHRVYKNFDPRARIIKKHCDAVLSKMKIKDPLLDIAKELEQAALADDYFAERKLYPNVDFYSGIIYKALGIPVEMFTVMFALGRLPGWIAQWRELMADPSLRISRPRQIYQGETKRTIDNALNLDV